MNQNLVFHKIMLPTTALSCPNPVANQMANNPGYCLINPILATESALEKCPCEESIMHFSIGL